MKVASGCPHCGTRRHGLRDAEGRFRRHGAPFTTALSRIRAEWRAYLDARYAAAEEATRGHLLSVEGWRRGVRPSSWFGGRPPRSDRWASQELRDWLRREGRPLSFGEWCAQVVEPCAEAA